MIRTFLIWAALCMAAAGQMQPAEHPANDTRNQPKARVEGKVLHASTLQPMRKVRVTLFSFGGQTQGRRIQPMTTSTDDQGKFVFTTVEPGNYQVVAQRTGYVTERLGGRGGRFGASVTAAPGSIVADLVIRLRPGAVVMGRVVDEDGEPLANAQVMVLRQRYTPQGTKDLVPASTDTTNDLGEFRIHSIEPGRYIVGAFLGPGRMGGGSMIGTEGGAGPDMAYAPVFYPNVFDASQAAQLSLRGGDETRIDITLTPQPAVHVRGRVVSTIPSPSQNRNRGMGIFLVPREGMGTRRFSPMMTSYDQGGNFEVANVTPGQYVLTVTTGDEKGTQYTASLPVTVGTSDIDGLVVNLTPGTDIPGKLKIEGQTDRKLTSFKVGLMSRSGNTMGFPMHDVTADGNFVINNAPSDAYLVVVSGVEGDFYLKSLRAGNEDLMFREFNVSPGRKMTPLEVVISTAVGSVSGVALDEHDKPMMNATVVLVPDEARRVRSSLFKTTTTDQNGAFAIRGVSPGEYRIYAWEDLPEGQWLDPEFLKQFEDRGQAIKIGEGETKSVRLAVIDAPDEGW